jgi:hypothetical protein
LIDRQVLKYAFNFDRFPTFICPLCRKGTLAAKSKHSSYEPHFSSQQSGSSNSDYEHVVLRVAGKLICQNSNCGQLVVFSADGGVEWGAGADFKGGWEEYFYLKTIHPAPWIIDIPRNADERLTKSLLAAFDTFWCNKALCANATRQAIENLLDFHQVPRQSPKSKRLTLAARISVLKISKPEYAELIDLFRPFLNAGSHGEEIETETLLNVLEALEIHLSQVFDDKFDRLVELKALLQK